MQHSCFIKPVNGIGKGSLTFKPELDKDTSLRIDVSLLGCDSAVVCGRQDSISFSVTANHVPRHYCELSVKQKNNNSVTVSVPNFYNPITQASKYSKGGVKWGVMLTLSSEMYIPPRGANAMLCNCFVQTNESSSALFLEPKNIFRGSNTHSILYSCADANEQKYILAVCSKQKSVLTCPWTSSNMHWKKVVKYLGAQMGAELNKENIFFELSILDSKQNEGFSLHMNDAATVSGKLFEWFNAGTKTHKHEIYPRDTKNFFLPINRFDVPVNEMDASLSLTGFPNAALAKNCGLVYNSSNCIIEFTPKPNRTGAVPIKTTFPPGLYTSKQFSDFIVGMYTVCTLDADSKNNIRISVPGELSFSNSEMQFFYETATSISQQGCIITLPSRCEGWFCLGFQLEHFVANDQFFSNKLFQEYLALCGPIVDTNGEHLWSVKDIKNSETSIFDIDNDRLADSAATDIESQSISFNCLKNAEQIFFQTMDCFCGSFCPETTMLPKNDARQDCSFSIKFFEKNSYLVQQSIDFSRGALVSYYEKPYFYKLKVGSRVFEGLMHHVNGKIEHFTGHVSPNGELSKSSAQTLAVDRNSNEVTLTFYNMTGKMLPLRSSSIVYMSA